MLLVTSNQAAMQNSINKAVESERSLIYIPINLIASGCSFFKPSRMCLCLEPPSPPPHFCHVPPVGRGVLFGNHCIKQAGFLSTPQRIGVSHVACRNICGALRHGSFQLATAHLILMLYGDFFDSVYRLWLLH